MTSSNGMNGLAFLELYKIYMLAMMTTSVCVNMENWTTKSNGRDGSGQVRTDHLLICLKINILSTIIHYKTFHYNTYIQDIYLLGSRVVGKLEGIIHSRQMKKDIRMLSPQLQTSNLEECHSLVNHIKLNSCKGFCLLSLILKICYLHAGEVTSRVRVEQMPHHEDIDHVPPPLVLCQQVLCQQFVYPENMRIQSLLTHFIRN